MLQVVLRQVPFRRALACHALRFTPTILHGSRSVNLPRHNLRHAEFSTSPTRSASEEPSTQSILHTQQKFARLFQEKPELRDLVINLKTTLEKEGINVQGGTMPGKMEIFKALLKPDVRDAVSKVSTAFQEAGINPKELMDELVALQKFLGPK